MLLKKGEARPMPRARPVKATKAAGLSPPTASRQPPVQKRAAVMAVILFRVPPHSPSSRDPASIPRE